MYTRREWPPKAVAADAHDARPSGGFCNYLLKVLMPISQKEFLGAIPADAHDARRSGGFCN